MSEHDTKISARGTRTLEDIYERCNIVAFELTSYIEAAKEKDWRLAM